MVLVSSMAAVKGGWPSMRSRACPWVAWLRHLFSMGGLVAGVHQHLVLQRRGRTGPGTVIGHERAPPVVRDVHVAARAVHAGDARESPPLLASATAAGGERRAVQRGQIGGTTGPVDGQRGAGSGTSPHVRPRRNMHPANARTTKAIARQDDVSRCFSRTAEVSAEGNEHTGGEVRQDVHSRGSCSPGPGWNGSPMFCRMVAVIVPWIPALRLR